MAEERRRYGIENPPDHDAEAFAEKLRHWREHGLNVVYPYGGRQEFSQWTHRERNEQNIAMAAAHGDTLEPKGQVRWI